jgi:hypothetical protein
MHFILNLIIEQCVNICDLIQISRQESLIDMQDHSNRHKPRLEQNFKDRKFKAGNDKPIRTLGPS